MAGPTLTAAQARSTTVVRVTWSATVKAESATDSDDALNPANYTISAVTVPAMPVVVDSVAAVYVGTTLVDTEFDLTLDTDTTCDASYTLAAAHVVALIGTTPGDPTPGTPTRTFTGYRPPYEAGRRWSLLAMVPQKNRTDDATEDLTKLIACWQDAVDLDLAGIDAFADLWDYDRCPASMLDALLYQMGNPFTFVLTEAEKRKLLATLADIYTQKGTQVGLVNVLRLFLGQEASLIFYVRDTCWEIPIHHLGGTDTDGQTVTANATTNKLSLAIDCRFEDDDPVEFTTTDTLPDPLTEGSTYYVRDVDGVTFKVAESAGGSAVDLTDTGVGTQTVFNRDPGNAIVGPGAAHLIWYYGFEVSLPSALTDEQRNRARFCINYMRPAFAYLVKLWEAGVQTWP